MIYLFYLLFSSLVVFANDLLINDFQTIQGDFIQTSIIDKEMIAKQNGRFYINNKGEACWNFNINSKFKKSLLVNSKSKLISIDKQLEQVIIFEDNQDSLLIKKFLTYKLNDLKDEFKIINAGLKYKLIPLKTNSLYKYVDLYLDKNNFISKLKLYYDDNEMLVIDFFNIKVNDYIGSNQFILQVPERYEIIANQNSNDYLRR